MSERRKPSTRNRGRPRAKRLSTPPLPKSRVVSPVAQSDEPFPSKVKGNHELPTSQEPPAINCPRSQFQDVRESGVLATSIERSRQQWLLEGVFERYWTKPSKKKSPTEVSNPAKESMVRLGSCTMIIEPHAFEVTLFTVKDTQFTVFLPAPQPSHSASSGIVGPFLPPATSFGVHVPCQSPNPTMQSKPASQPTLPPFREGFAQFDPQGLGPSAVPTRITPGPAAANPRASNSNLGAAPREPVANSDPVIQMLAARAATDHDLKSLMKVVAQGNASPEQLKIFQKHIDELNNIIEAHNDRPTSDEVPPAKPADATVRPPVSESNAASQPRHTVALNAAGQALSTSSVVGIKTEPLSQYYSQPPQPLKARAPVAPQQDASAIVFEFTAGTGDRYSLPKYSILEYLPGNTQVLVSFLITRKGNTAASGKYKDNVEYYQPVTIRLSTHNSRILEALPKFVAPAEEARKYVTEVMSKMTTAEEVHLVTRSAHTQEVTSTEQEDGPSISEADVLSSKYSPPNSLLPIYSTTKA